MKETKPPLIPLKENSKAAQAVLDGKVKGWKEFCRLWDLPLLLQ